MKKLLAAFAAFAIPLAGAFADDDYGPFGSDNDIVYDESPPATMIMLENVTLKMGAVPLMEDGNCVALYRKSDSSLCGLGSVYEYGGNLYLDISVMGISRGTQVHFKVWRKSDDTVFDCDAASDYTLPASGDDSGLVINVIPPTYAITYAPGSQGAGNGQSATKTYGTDLSLAPALFTRTGYSQTGWATTDGGEKAYDLGGTYTTNAVATLFPTWGVNSYTMSFDPNGGAFDDTGSTVARSAEMDYGAELSTPAVSREGHTFAGWSPAVPATVPAENATYVAQWTVNSYTVTFDAGEGTGGWSDTLDYGAELSPPTVTWTGHEFKRWVPDVPATVPVGGGTYVAQWDTLKFSITFDPNGGAFNASGGTAATTELLDYGAELSTPAVSRDGHTFAGWSPAVPATVPAENATYVAQWTVNSYTVTFDAGEGTGGWSDTLDYGAELSPPTVTWTGHEFKRWVPDVPAAVPVGGGTYVAQWDTLKFSITFDPNGGAFDDTGSTVARSAEMDYGAELSTPAVSRDGHTFAGWSPAVPATVPAENATYVAQWTVNSYTVTFDAGAGTGGWSATLDYGAELSPPTVTWTGHEFKRWVPDVPATVPVGGGTYVAQWDTLKFSITFDPNGGAFDASGGTAATTELLDYGAEILAPAVSRTGYELTGWSPALPATASADTAYAAQWSPRTYGVTLDAQGGSGGSPNVTATFDAPMPPITVPVSSTQAFRGYFTEIGGTGTQYYDAFGNSAHVWDVASDGVTLHAFWENVATLSLSVGKFGKAQVEIGGESFQVGPDVLTNIEVSTDAQLAVRVTAQPGAGFAMSGGEAEYAWTPFTANQNVSYAFIPQLPGATLDWKFSKAIGRYFAQVKIPAHAGYAEALAGLSFLFADRTNGGDAIPYAQLWDAAARAPFGVMVTDNGVDFRGVALGEGAFAGAADGDGVVFGVSDATLAASDQAVPAGERQIGLFVRKRVSPVSGNETSGEVNNFLGYLSWTTEGTRYFLPIVGGADNGAVATTTATMLSSPRRSSVPPVATRAYSPATLGASKALGLAAATLAAEEPKARIAEFNVGADGSVSGRVEAVAGGERSASFGTSATVRLLAAESLGGEWAEVASAEVDSATGMFTIPADRVDGGRFFKAEIDVEEIYE